MKKVLVDGRISQKCESTLISLGYAIIKLPPFPRLPAPVASHPDMLVFIDKNKLICHADYYPIAKAELESIGLEIVRTEEPIENVYPRDILFNAAKVGNCIFCKTDYISKEIKKLEYKLIDIKQGYAKCSCCTVSDKAIITSDPSLERAAVSVGVDVLKISPAHIELPGYDTGFIGGASGVTDDFVVFCGNIDTHPDASKIKIFCKKHGKDTISLSDEPLFDLGTLFFL